MRGEDMTASESNATRKEHEQEQEQEHPHIRGEDSRFHKRGHACKGTSPHAWGRQREAIFRHMREQGHPHMRGEDAFVNDVHP